MKVLITGGNGDLGTILQWHLEARGDEVVVLDSHPSRYPIPKSSQFVQGSLLDEALLAKALTGVDSVIHIAALHGIHEFRRSHSAREFWDINVTGTFLLFEAAVSAGVGRVVFLSSTSVKDWPSIYGCTKIHGEEISRSYSARHQMNVLSLRPRAFIPHWNTSVYSSYIDWAKWFWGGAVHITDVARGVLKGLELLQRPSFVPYSCITLDGAYDYSSQDLEAWDAEGPGSSFRKHYDEYYDLALRYGLDPAKKPNMISDPQSAKIGYKPMFSLRNLLQELQEYGEAGPPPFFAR